MTTRLFVGNLSFDTTEQSLARAFADQGFEPTRVMVPTDRDTGRPRGFGFVDLASADQVGAAIAALDGQEVDGRRLRVSEAQQREDRGPRGGRDERGPRSSDGGRPPRPAPVDGGRPRRSDDLDRGERDPRPPLRGGPARPRAIAESGDGDGRDRGRRRRGKDDAERRKDWFREGGRPRGKRSPSDDDDFGFDDYEEA